MIREIPSLFSMATRAAYGLPLPIQPDWFKYESIQHGYKNDGTFVAGGLGVNFRSLSYGGEEPTIFDFSNDDVGWKIHIAIDDRNNINIARAWNLVIKNIVLRYRLMSKVIKSNVIFYGHESQSGKQVTIYHCGTPNRAWGQIIRALEILLRRIDAPIGQFSPADRVILGSRYISYRNDKDKNGKYIPAARLAPGQYNPGTQNDDDPLLDIDLRGLN